MSDCKKRIESVLFDYKTTAGTDFRDGEIEPFIKTEYKEKSVCIRERPLALKDIHTLTNWTSYVRFDLLIKPKEIVRTNPRIIQKAYEELVDEEREQVLKTRPRLVMTPACSIDDFEDERGRKVFIDDMYTTSVMKTLGGSKNSRKNKIISPLRDRPAPAKPITLPALQPPYISPEWRMDGVSWDSSQLRTHCPSDKQFWLRRVPPGHRVTNINF